LVFISNHLVPEDVNGNFFETIIANFENLSEAKQPNVKKNQTNGLILVFHSQF